MVAELKVRVTPKAAKDGLGGVWEGPEGERRLIVRVTVVPEKGKANKAVTALLAKKLGVPKSALTLTAGETDRNKTFAIDAEGAAAAVASLWKEAEA